MNKMLDKVYTPKEIYILWQNMSENDAMPGGKKYPVGKLIYINEDLWNLEYFDISAPSNFIGYLPYKFVPNKVYKNVKATFTRRLPPKKREDFKEFLKEYQISETCIDIDDFALLAYTEGNLPSDNFSFINPLTEVPIDGEFIILIAGFRHYDGNNRQSSLIGEKVIFQKEPDNIYDKNAVIITLENGLILGYVSIIQNERINYLLNNDINIDAHITAVKDYNTRKQVFVYVKTNKGQE